MHSDSNNHSITEPIAFDTTFLEPFDANEIQDSICRSFGELRCKKFYMLVLEFT